LETRIIIVSRADLVGTAGNNLGTFQCIHYA
jgi:hypothetical protein